MQKVKNIIWLCFCMAIVTFISCNENINPVQPQTENNEGKKLPNLNTVSENNQVKIVLLGEAPYIKGIIKQKHPDLIDENFESYNGGSQDSIFYSIRDRFSTLPENQWPLVISPFNNFLTINNFLNNHFVGPKGFIVVMAYRAGAPTYPSNPLYVSNINKDLILIGAGEYGTDWTKGNGLQFYKQSPVQYFNGSTPVTEFIVDSLVQFGSNETRIYTQAPNWLHLRGVPIWLTLNGIKNRYTVITDSVYGAGYIGINRIVFSNFISGSFYVHWQSGSVAYFGSDLYAVKKKWDCSYQETVSRIKYTASNANQWNDSTGYGLPNIKKAVNLLWPPISRY